MLSNEGKLFKFNEDEMEKEIETALVRSGFISTYSLSER
jgi:hypothetical protein